MRKTGMLRELREIMAESRDKDRRRYIQAGVLVRKIRSAPEELLRGYEHQVRWLLLGGHRKGK